MTPQPTDTNLKNQLVTLPLDELTLMNYRDPGDLADLQASIEKLGQLQPITVYRSGRNRYTVLEGHRRTLACKNLGRTEIRALVVETAHPELLQVAINEVRKQHSAFELASAFKKMHDELGMKQEDIAAALGKTPALVSKYLSLLKNYNPPLFSLLSGKTLYHHNNTYYCGDEEIKKADIEIAAYEQMKKYKVKTPLALNAAEPLAKLLDEVKGDAALLAKFNHFVVKEILQKNRTGNLDKQVALFREQHLEPKELAPAKGPGDEHAEAFKKQIEKLFQWMGHYPEPADFQKRLNAHLKEIYKDRKIRVVVSVD